MLKVRRKNTENEDTLSSDYYYDDDDEMCIITVAKLLNTNVSILETIKIRSIVYRMINHW